VKFGQPEWVGGKATQVFGQFFSPAEMSVVQQRKGYLLTRLEHFTAKSEVLEESICGFTEQALELSGAKSVTVERTHSIARGDPFAEFEGKWEQV
jgi:hypothetical protein